MRLIIETEPGINDSLRSAFDESDFLDPEYDEFIIGVTGHSQMVYDYDSLVEFILRNQTPANCTFEEYIKTDEGRDLNKKIKDEVFYHVIVNNVDILLLNLLF